MRTTVQAHSVQRIVMRVVEFPPTAERSWPFWNVETIYFNGSSVLHFDAFTETRPNALIAEHGLGNAWTVYESPSLSTSGG